jgi:phosphoglycolate phosphatase
MRYRAIICDLDMTLIDSRRDIAAAVTRALRKVLGREVPNTAVYKLIGRPLDEVIAALAPKAKRDVIERCVDEYKSDFYDRCCRFTRIYPGVRETLTALGEQGVRRAVATTKMTYMARRVCDGVGLSDYFEHIQGTDDCPAKPDPAVLVRAAEGLDVPLRQTLVVGDTVLDIEAARRGRCAVAAVTYGVGKRDELRQAKPDFLIDAFSAVLKVMNGGPK